ncbi:MULTISPECIES: hypothetical protein [unclassified Streptococcus]|uniref:hypothetical protein n=1 Tax=unclassified Streptococcus TaxID=2608887 RepID=UPI0011B83592|nr:MULTISPECIES: hypothetical protein [unclassified Streptococcus]TWS94354.1 hypothetical protein FRX52_04225 [Streptococcus sp. sy018]TWT14631.1 hypothetical protein FRX51_03410 [Streptococcus sp. sy010]
MKNKDMSYLKYGVWLCNILIAIHLMIAIGLVIFSMIGVVNNGYLTDWLANFQKTNVLLSGLSVTIFGVIFMLWNLVLPIAILICIRQFFKNILTNHVFIFQNVRLARILTVLTAVVGIVSMNLTYVLIAGLIWAMSKVIEQANVIAEENKFII